MNTPRADPSTSWLDGRRLLLPSRMFAQCRTGTVVELDPTYADDPVPLATAISARLAAKCPF